ncbi:TPA: type VI secretion system baseplate subunit TssF [Escherichia coli]|nr:type VI secretion system baseplate subunit TssF [Escherichia coli]HAW2254133.1 type VI secretion system baseplate subunit TssF [Escherichia coli]
MEFEERYFREELDYLRQLSKLLATEKPHLARFLAEKDADPDIERLLEGVAFLTGNLRQKIEDEFPELTHGLIKMLWPNYLRPVPAMTLIEYTPDMDKSSVPVLIPRNEQFTTNAGEIRVDEVLPSDAKKEEPPPCTFTLCRDIWLLPVRLEQIENRSTTRNGVINITFSVAPGTDFRTLDLNKLRFWLGNDDNYTRDQLYLWFCEYLQGADLTVGEQHIRLPEFMLKAVGFEPQDAMLPWPKNVHSGYLDMLPEGDPRDQFHRQYLAAQLTEEAGLVQLAQQQYRMLFRMGLQMMVADWEPSLLEQLEQKFTAEQ